MKRILSLALSLFLIGHHAAFAFSTSLPSLSGIVKNSDLIVVASLKEAQTFYRHGELEQQVGWVRTCAVITRVVHGEAPKDSFCFEFRSPIKVGAEYLLFLSKESSLDKEAGVEASQYLGLLAFEVVGPNPYHDYAVVRWEALEHPLVEGLTEKTAEIDCKDARDTKRDRSIAVYAHFPLEAIEAVVRGTIGE